LDLARLYVAAGLSVIPIRPDGSKAPPDSYSWKVFQSRRATDAELVCGFSSGVNGIAIVCGAVSGNLEVVDFDSIPLFERWLSLLRDEKPALISGLTILHTPEGRHVYLRLPGPVPRSRKLARNVAGETLIETKGEGGYVLAPGCPPSCHPTGGRYQHFSGPPLDQLASLDGYESLIDLAKSLNEFVKPGGFESQLHAPTGNGKPDGLRPGDDFNIRATWTDVLTPRKWVTTGTRDGLTYWRRPDKSTPGMSATTGVRSECGQDLLYVFSTNALPFEAEKSYSKFSAYALLEHHGDFHAAAAVLARAGFGDPDSLAGVTIVGITAAAQVGEVPNCQQARLPARPGDAAFYGLAGKIVAVIEPASEADRTALLVQILVAFGNVIGRNAHFTVEADRHHGNEFVVLVGRTSKARKGTSWGHIIRLFREAVELWAKDHVQTGLSSGEGVIWAVRDPIQKMERIKERGKSVRYESVEADPGVSDKRLLVYEPEFANVLKQTDRQGNILSAVLRQAWDGGDLRTLTKNSPARAKAPHISLIGHITTDELRRYLLQTEAANGFGNRHLWICADRSKLLPEGGSVDQATWETLRNELTAAVTFATTAEEMKRDAEARALWREKYGPLSEGKPGLAGALLARGEAHVLRLSMLYALLDQSTVIRAEHLQAALALWAYAARSVRFIFGDALGDPLADDLLRLLRNSLEGLTRTELSNYLGRNLSSDRIGRALGLLLQARMVRYERQQTDGRPVERWFAVTPSPNESGP
jgi:hypothetical protein